METRIRRNVNIHDQENIYAAKKVGVPIPTKRLGLKARGALGELTINTNIQNPTNVNVSKLAAACDVEKKSSSRLVRSYKHVQSKVDTGMSNLKDSIQPSSRPPLRREESTGNLAARAIATRVVLKDTQQKQVELKIPSNPSVQTKNGLLEKKRLPTLKEHVKEVKPCSLKPAIGESLGKLKLNDNNTVTRHVRALVKESKKTPELPADIEDIDAGDKNTVKLMSPYIKDIYKYLTHLETKYAIVENHLEKQIMITGNMRATLIDWLVDVQNQFALELETFHMTVGIIDRYLQIVTNVNKCNLQLIGVTAMLIASKYEEVYPQDVSSFVYITNNAYTVAEVLACEVEILNKLDFCLARPLPISFQRRFIKAARGTPCSHHLAKYFVDLCLVEYSMAHYRPSELAAAAVCLSLYLLTKRKLTEIWSPTMSYYSEYSLDHLEPIMHKIAKLVTNVEKSKHKTVYKKYLDKKLDQVSALPVLKGVLIQELAKKV